MQSFISCVGKNNLCLYVRLQCQSVKCCEAADGSYIQVESEDARFVIVVSAFSVPPKALRI